MSPEKLDRIDDLNDLLTTKVEAAILSALVMARRMGGKCRENNATGKHEIESDE